VQGDDLDDNDVVTLPNNTIRVISSHLSHVESVAFSLASRNFRCAAIACSPLFDQVMYDITTCKSTASCEGFYGLIGSITSLRGGQHKKVLVHIFTHAPFWESALALLGKYPLLFQVNIVHCGLGGTLHASTIPIGCNMVHLDVAHGSLCGDVELPRTCASVVLGDWFPASVQQFVRQVDVSKCYVEPGMLESGGAFAGYNMHVLFPGMSKLIVGGHDHFLTSGHFPPSLRELQLCGLRASSEHLLSRVPHLQALLVEHLDACISTCMHPSITTLCCTHACTSTLDLRPPLHSYVLAFPSLRNVCCDVRFWGVECGNEWLTIHDSVQDPILIPPQCFDSFRTWGVLQLCHVVIHAPLHIVESPGSVVGTHTHSSGSYHVYIRDQSDIVVPVLQYGTRVFDTRGMGGGAFGGLWPSESTYMHVRRLLGQGHQ
jgi:hypothetical protein